MIYTVTFNPSIDYMIETAEFTTGRVNRAGFEQFFWGGKGINVSTVLNGLRLKTIALGFIAGFTGKAIEAGLRSNGIKTDFIELSEGLSRINVKIQSDEETEINGYGPDITWDDVDKLYEKLDALKAGDTLVLAGSVPRNLPDNIYGLILERVSGKRIRTVVDAEKKLLLGALSAKPFLVKPNIHELGDLFGVEVKGEDDAAHYAKKLKEMGAVNVLVSMGADGAILLDENGELHKCEASSHSNAISTVGAGDSMVAGFIAGLTEKDGDYEYALKYGTAAGCATALSNGLAKSTDICAELMALGIL